MQHLLNYNNKMKSHVRANKHQLRINIRKNNTFFEKFNSNR